MATFDKGPADLQFAAARSLRGPIQAKDEAARKASFDAFGKDADWQTARKASEEKAGGSLTIKGGVKFREKSVLCSECAARQAKIGNPYGATAGRRD